MAGIQATGLGSGLDIENLVTQLVAAEGAPLRQRIVREETSVTTRISALGTLKGALSAFQKALEPLHDGTAFRTYKTVSGDTDAFTVTASADATPGRFEVEVIQLARGHQLASSAFAEGAETRVGDGTLTISVGGESFSVTIAPDAATLEDIRDAINGAEDNAGVRATLLTGVDGTRLVLTSAETGADQAITVTANGGDGGLAALAYDPDGVMSLQEIQAPQNALLRVSGFDAESSTNVFEDVIEGVTITALAPSEDGPATLDVTFDAAAAEDAISELVDAYNALRGQIKKLGGYDAATETAGPMLGDPLLRAIETEMRRLTVDPVDGLGGAYTTLASIGITTDATGALQIDSDALTAALDDDPDAVARLLGGEGGVANRLYERLEDRLATGGDLDTRRQRLDDAMKGIEREKEAVNRRLEQIEARYRAQFTALDALLMRMQTTSSYLTQQLQNAAKALQR
ncbi:MAG TPA: flagellar filament capping protein FliD [Gammaproteobacteria bacterium]